MFQSALVRRHSTGQKAVDAGMLAETLLFYNSVHIVTDRGILFELLSGVGLDNIVQLLDGKIITIIYSRNIPVVMNNNINFVSEYSFALMKLHAHKNRKKIGTSDEITEIVESVSGSSRHSKKMAKKLKGHLIYRDISFGNAKYSREVVDAELRDDKLLKSYVQSYLYCILPDYNIPYDWYFRFVVKTKTKISFIF